ncbi:uncharacterized protein LACBIDRAFT_336298, partial [Laccaria bicolor S238N-H82]
TILIKFKADGKAVWSKYSDHNLLSPDNHIICISWNLRGDSTTNGLILTGYGPCMLLNYQKIIGYTHIPSTQYKRLITMSGSHNISIPFSLPKDQHCCGYENFASWKTLMIAHGKPQGYLKYWENRGLYTLWCIPYGIHMEWVDSTIIPWIPYGIFLFTMDSI